MLKKVLASLSALVFCIALLFFGMWYMAPIEEKDILPAVFMTFLGILMSFAASRMKG